jgi:hypothetical protein
MSLEAEAVALENKARGEPMARLSDPAEAERYRVVSEALDQYKGVINDYAHTKAEATQAAKELADEEARLEGIARRSGIAAGNLAKAISVLGDDESTAADKADALNTALSLLMQGREQGFRVKPRWEMEPPIGRRH